MAKKQKYRLQVVLDRKEEARDQAALYLAECRSLLKQELAEEHRLQEEMRQNRERKQKEYEEMTFEVGKIQQRLNYIKFLDAKAEELQEQIEIQKEKVKQAEQRVEEALKDLIRASRELQVMQKHKERWQAKINKEEELVQENEMNEIGNVIYEQNRKEAFYGH